MNKLYVLVWVHRGLIQEPEIFITAAEANNKKKSIEKSIFNPTYDEVQIFEKNL